MTLAGDAGRYGEGHNRMVLGIARERVKQADAGRVRDAAWHPGRPGEAGWREERGQIRLECPVDVIGGFPGGGHRGARLDGAHLRITDRYLLVDEGRPHGFGLPIGWLCGVQSIPQADRSSKALRVRYLDGAIHRTFVLRFRSPLLTLGSPRRAEQAIAALHAAGLRDSAASAVARDPGLTLGWDEAARYEQENVIWNGRVTAPIGTGLERAGCDVWLTTRSLIWGSGTGEGIQRAALEQIRDVTAVDVTGRTATPSLIVGFEDAGGDRHDLAFLFNRQTPERNVRERGACLVGLRSRGLSLGVLPTLVQPWQPVSLALSEVPSRFPSAGVALAGDLGPSSHPELDPVEPLLEAPVAAGRPGAAELGAPAASGLLVEASPALPAEEWPVEAVGNSVEARTMPSPIPSEEDSANGGSGEGEEMPEVASNTDSPALLTPPLDGDFVTEGTADIARGWPVNNRSLSIPAAPAPPAALDAPSPDRETHLLLVPEDDTAGEMRDQDTRVTLIETVPPPASPDGLERAQAYEAAALSFLADVLRGIDARVAGQDAAPLAAVLPPEGQRVAAVAQIGDWEARGVLSQGEANARRARLIAAGEAGPRLRSLLELHDAGWVSPVALARKRQAITDQLDRLLNGDGSNG